MPPSGGFHLFEADACDARLDGGEASGDGASELSRGPLHGIEAVFGLRQRLELNRNTCAVGAVGARFSLKSGLDPGAIAR